MATWNNRTLNKVLSPYRTRNRYKYQLYDYLREVNNRQKSLEKVLDEDPDELNSLVR